MFRSVYTIGLSCVIAGVLSAAVPLSTTSAIDKNKLDKISAISTTLPKISAIRVSPTQLSADTQKVSPDTWAWSLSIADLNPEDLKSGFYFITLQQLDENFNQKRVCDIQTISIDKNLKVTAPITLSGTWININASKVDVKLYKKTSFTNELLHSKMVDVPKYQAEISDLKYDTSTNMVHFVATNKSVAPLSLTLSVNNKSKDGNSEYAADAMPLVLKPNESFIYDKRYNFLSRPMETLIVRLYSHRNACSNPSRPVFPLALDKKEQSY